MPVVIAGFPSTNRVPGPFGEVLYGTSGQSAATFPLAVLLVGLKTTNGNLTADTEIRQIFSKQDADVAAEAGSELACMAYDALDCAPAGTPVFLAAPTAAGGAVAASATATFGGAWTTGGQVTFRIGGKSVPVTVLSNDTPTTMATAAAAAIKGAFQGRLPLTASNATVITTITCKTAGIRGNQHIVFVDLSQAPSGLTCVLAGGTAVTGGGVPLVSGTGQETYTNLLATILTSQFDRIALAANDAASAAAWKTQIDAQAAAPVNILQHVVVATNGNTSPTSLAQTTLNDQRFQVLWAINSETHPSRIAAAFAAVRAATEQSDPNAAYNFTLLPTVAPMSQKADWPSMAVLVSALNNSVTPLTTQIGDTAARVVRSITSKSLTAGNPDYSTFDTGQAATPDFVLRDLGVFWRQFAAVNPRVQDNPTSGQRIPASGVAYPDLWSAKVFAKLVDYSNGILSGTSATVAPIIINPVTPVSNFDNSAKRIMSAITVTPAFNDAQVGISVRQAA